MPQCERRAKEKEEVATKVNQDMKLCQGWANEGSAHSKEALAVQVGQVELASEVNTLLHW